MTTNSLEKVDLRWASDALHFGIERTRSNMSTLTGFPERTADNEWICVENGGWVGGHWVGLLWLAFANTGEGIFREMAYRWAARLAPRQTDTTTHDLGFLFELSHVLGSKLVQDDTLKAPAETAAQTLSRRYNGRGKFIQAWGALDDSKALRGRIIIDTMMNPNLLFWAGQEGNDPSYAQIADAHAQTALEYQIRNNFSTAHVADFDPDTGVFIKQDTHQGYSATSCWSRGQSWAVYGFATCYQATGKHTYFHVAKNLAEYALMHLPPDRVPYWDYDRPAEDVTRDSSAAAILASGLLLLANLEDDPAERKHWKSEAHTILKSLWKNYSSSGTDTPSILLHGTRSKPEELFDHGLIYGDYYFVEALTRLLKPTLL